MKNFRIVVFVLAVILSSCDSENDTSGNTITGVLTGRVDLYDTDGLYVTDKQGVSVSIEGTDIRVTTTAEGKWIMNNLPAGIYDLTFEKPGYGYEKVFGYQFIGGGTAYFDPIDLSQEQLDKIGFETFTISRNSDRLELGILGTTPRQTGQSLLLYISSEKAKLFGEHHNNAEVAVSIYSYPSQGQFGGTFVFAKEFFDTISSGTILYATVRMLAFGENLYKYSSYFDPIQYKWIYTSAGPMSEILSDTVP